MGKVFLTARIDHFDPIESVFNPGVVFLPEVKWKMIFIVIISQNHIRKEIVVFGIKLNDSSLNDLPKVFAKGKRVFQVTKKGLGKK